MATTLSSPLSDPGGRLTCQELALAVVLVDLANTSKEIKDHSVFLNYSAFRGISSFTPTGYGAIAGTIGSHSNPPETGY